MSRYRETFSNLLNEVRIVEQMKTMKLRNGAKVLDKVFSNRTQADNAAKSLMTQHKGVEADAYQSPFNNRFYVRIKEENINEKIEYVEYKFNSKNTALQAKRYLDGINNIDLDVNDDAIGIGELTVDAGKKDMTSVHNTIVSRFRPKVVTKENIKEQDDKDHEVSMARGELEAIASKATELASMLQSKSDEGNPLEAWVQSKITKAKDYIASVSDYLMYNPDMKQNEENSKEIQKDKTDNYKDKNKKLEEGFSSTLKMKAKEIAKKMADNMTGAVKEIEKLAKGLSDDPEVEKALKMYNENVQEGRMSDIDAMRKDGASAEKIAKELKIDVKIVKSILGEETELQEFSDAQISQLKRAYSPLKGQKMSLNHANQLMGIFSKFDNNKDTLEKLVKANIPFVSDLAISRLISKHNYKADKLKTLKAGYMSEGTMKGGIVKYSGQSSSEYNKAKSAYKQFMSKPQPAKSAEDKVLPFIFDDELLDDLYVASKKNVSDVRPIVKKRLQALGIKEDVYEGAKLTFETIQAVKNKADKTNMPYSILKQVYDRGMAAWKGGHRPGATQQQWALARVNSFVTKSSGTWGGADSDLAAKVKGSK